MRCFCNMLELLLQQAALHRTLLTANIQGGQEREKKKPRNDYHNRPRSLASERFGQKGDQRHQMPQQQNGDSPHY